MATDKIQVAVRVRPTNRREIELGTKCVVDMEGNQTVLYHPKDSPLTVSGSPRTDINEDNKQDGRRKTPKTFAFDYSFWSMDKDNPKFDCQDAVFKSLGESVLGHAFEGYNGCIFAYGQTGSGKSYTMMGTSDEKGIIPRLCDALFDRISRLEDEATSFKVEVSYMEIYNEKVHDLLDLKGSRSKQNLKVREHNILGPYVDGLSTLMVASFADINNLMSEGNKSRTVAATNMNSESSRSHAVFNIIVTQTLVDLQAAVSGEKVSKLSLVDLAGSERAQKTGAMGDRLREGSNINKSLTTLGLVISALADQGGSRHKNKFVPYRDSVLTWLLKDNLGGNSKTVMIATISPSGDNYEETLSTLRYADRAKRIVNHAVVNEDPNARIIRELRSEVDTLKTELEKAQSMKAPDLKEKLEESEKLLKEMRKTWEEKLAETEKIHHERHQALEQMGISVETSGIKVEHSHYFLVNLNADPSLNELLVYYLKERTLVGCPDADSQPDIQLSGLGIQPRHCVVEIDDNDVYVSPADGARTCVNGSVIIHRVRVKHGDRLLWGNNHFFRINCPIQNSPSTNSPDADQTIDYNFAQQELMMKEFSNDPISEAISAVEQQYEEDKQEALEKQRQMYERQMQMLRYQLMSPGTPSMPFPPMDLSKLTPTGSSGIQRKYQQWATDRDRMFKQSLCRLREEVVKANSLVREANFLADEMGKQTEFHVTLQIPACNLSPNRRRGALVSEPAILVRRKHRSSQVWSMEKFENKIIDMRDMYEDRKAQGVPLMVDDSSSESDLDDAPIQKGDPFYELQENHNLIGVANVFLDCLFYDVKLDYHVPIISQHGEVAGKLHIEISKLGGPIMDRYADIHCDTDSDDENSSFSVGTPLIIRVKIHAAKGLPKELSNFVFCQYSFWGNETSLSVPPEITPDSNSERKDKKNVRFAHEKDFKVYMSEEFIEHCQEGALSIEVLGHKTVGFGHQTSVADSLTRSNSLAERWDEVTRKIEVWVEIHEVNDAGEYAPVEVKSQTEVPCSGVFQLRQGHARRILTRVKATTNSGTLPLICDGITSVSLGCICARSKLQRGLDSYQEEDLNHLRERWSDALARRHKYLDSQIQKLINKQDKTEADCDRERALIDQWVSLTEERNAVLVPAAGSGIPGAPADWEAPADMEQHRPVLYLDLNSDDMTTSSAKEGLQAVGINSIIPKEQAANYVVLPVVKAYTEKKSICALGSWDSAIHDSPHLNRITGANDRVYLILKTVVRLSHPAYMELVLRKRLCVNVKHRNMSITDKLKKRWIGTDGLHASGITYDVVSNIPKASEDLEEMETLAQMAASQNEVSAADGETYIEKYIKGVSAVESILTLDRLRQEVAVKELMATQGRSLRKTTSVPNIHQFVTTPPRLDEKMRFDSIQDLTFHDFKSSAITPANPKCALSPMSGKLTVKPLQTLQEEQHHGREARPLMDRDTEDEESPVELESSDLNLSRTTLNVSKQELLDNKQDLLDLKMDLKNLKKSLIEPDPSSVASDDFQEFESYQSQTFKQAESSKGVNIPHSGTSDSIAENQFKSCTPSMTSSGYGSQAVSTLTLSSEDSLSLRSNDDTTDANKLARRGGLEHTSSGESDGDDANIGSGRVTAIHEEDDSSTISTESLVRLVPVESEDSKASVHVKEEQVCSVNNDSNVENIDMLQLSFHNENVVYESEAQLEKSSKIIIDTKVEEIESEDSKASVHVKEEQVCSVNNDSNLDNIDVLQESFHNDNVVSESEAQLEKSLKILIDTKVEEIESEDSKASVHVKEEQVCSVNNDSNLDNIDVLQESFHNENVVSETEAQLQKPSKILIGTKVEEIENVLLQCEDNAYSFEPTKFIELHISEEDLHTCSDEEYKTNADKMSENVLNICETEIKMNEHFEKDTNALQSKERLDSVEIVISAAKCDDVSMEYVQSEQKDTEVKLSTENSTSEQNSTNLAMDVQKSVDDNIPCRRRIEGNFLIEDAISSSVDDSAQKPVNMYSVASDSSSNASHGMLPSDSVDPYSLDAMEELERLGEEFGMDNSEFTSIDDRTDNESVRDVTADEKLDGSKCDMNLKPHHQSTPKRDLDRSPRPVSCFVKSHHELSDSSIEGMMKRNSLDLSDDHLSECDSLSTCSFGSRADLDRLQEVPVPSWIQVRESVIVSSSRTAAKLTGVVQFVGNVEFASGPWIGVELDLADGKNDGSVNGIRYFRCRSRHGIFVRHDKLIWDKKRKGSRRSAANAASALNRRSHVQSPSSPHTKGTPTSSKRK